MKSVLAMSCVLVGLTASSVFAQADDAHAQKMANIRKLMNVTGGSKMMDQMFSAMAANFSKDPKAQEIFQQFRKEMDPNQLYDIVVPFYDKYLSDEDVRQIIAFYESPTGKKMVDAMPRIMMDAMPAIMQWSQELSARMQQKLKESQQK